MAPALAPSSTARRRAGRFISRVEPDYATTWHHDRDANGAPCGASIGKTCETQTSTGVKRQTFYDALGRFSSSRSDLDNGQRSFATSVSYDDLGRPSTQTYPTGLTTRNHYTPGLGFLQKVTTVTALSGAAPKAANSLLWQAHAFNAWGKLERQAFGNQVQAQVAYEPQTGRRQTLSAGLGSASSIPNNIVHQRLHWDSLNQLTTRVDGVAGGGANPVEISDSYTFDALGRMTQYVVAGSGTPSQRTVNLQYNALGMLLYKTDVGVYTYPAQGVANGKPHAVQSVAGVHNAAYGFDLNGNVQTASGGKYRSVAYTSFNLPDATTGLQGPAGTPKYTWVYGENHARVKEVRTNSAGTRTTWFLHPDNQGGLAFEREENPDGSVQNRHYIGGYAVITTDGALPDLTGRVAPIEAGLLAATKLEYWHKDHLGSIIAITNSAGAATAFYSYDPFGKRRQVNGSYDPFGTLVVDFGPGTQSGTDRGFTGHEHLDDVGVIHMNGRIFDPLIARFMQADPLIQNAFNLQNFDRYGYCYNDPTTCTDLSGFQAVDDRIEITGRRLGLSNDASGGYLARWMSSGGVNSYSGSQPTATPVPTRATVAAGCLMSYSCMAPKVSAATTGFAAAVKQALKQTKDPRKALVLAIAIAMAERAADEKKAQDALGTGGGADTPANTPDPASGSDPDRGGLTTAGRAQQKHGDREGSAFDPATGNPQDKNAQGQRTVDSIVNSPDRVDKPNRHGGIDVLESPGGRGARFGPGGKFTGFLEP